ncbi:SWIB/MDM2 domain-containing protein [Flagelloscypha sp. PMI_526]|nr:SWIB/MDM2 domain-containing protein [Flagelloscypha sp. PMI_526]
MATDVASLKPSIHAILTAPGTDFLDEFIRENKESVDRCIAETYEEVNSAASGSNGDSTKRKYEDEDVSDSGATEASKTSKRAKREGSQLSDDEAYARQLAQELNGRASRRGPSKSAYKPSPKRGKNVKKSAETIDTDSDDDGDNSSPSKSRKKKTASPKKRSGGTGGGFTKEMALSEPLAAVLQVDKLARTQVVKQLWVYIKANNLQNPLNKREILCDGPLRAVFGSDKIDMFKMNKVLGQHLRGPDE